MKRTFVCYSDPGHGWVKVPEGVIAAMGLKAASFTGYSYLNKGHMYLEEDGDASLFVKTYKEKFGVDPKFSERNCNTRSRIRNYHNNNPEAARYFVPSIAA